MHFQQLSLNIAIAFTMTLAILSPTMAGATDDNDQTIDMSSLTCGEFQELGRREKAMSLIWLSGWMAQQQGDFQFTPDRGVISERKDDLEKACENNDNGLVMNELLLQSNK